MKKSAIRRAFERRVLLPLARKALDLRPVDDRRGWWKILESYSGAWQQNVEINPDTVDAYWANFACVTLICSDIAKMPLAVMNYDAANDIWVKSKKRPVLRKPNNFQTTIEFVFSWIVSQLRYGNTYVLKQRDDKDFVKAMFVLDPRKVTPLVTRLGDVYYQLNTDELAGLNNAEPLIVPASEIIHDRMYTLHHPLVGVSPVYACGMQAMQGAAIIGTSAGFFTNRGLPAGVLTAPGHIPDDTAQRLKQYFEDNFTGQNAGKIAVLGDNLKFETLAATATDSQLIEQLKMTGEMIAACYHVPGYKIGVGQMPSVSNTAALNQQYYDQCLQFLVEKMEARLDDGLELKDGEEECWFDTTALMRMDPSTMSTVMGQKVKDGIYSPNEARRADNLPPVKGGDQPFLQQQNYSLGDLAERSSRDAAKTDNVQGQAMNGAQVTSLQAMLTAAATGAMPPETVSAAIAAAFPLLSTAQIFAMLNPLQDFEPAATEPPPAATPSATATPPTTAQEDDPGASDKGMRNEEDDDDLQEIELSTLLADAHKGAVTWH